MREEKLELAEQVKVLESNFKCMERKLQEAQKQRDIAQKGLKKLNYELLMAKERCMNEEKERARAEHLLKSEVRVLLEKLAASKPPAQQATKGFRSTSANDLKLKNFSKCLATSKIGIQSTFDPNSSEQPLMRNFTSMESWASSQSNQKKAAKDCTRRASRKAAEIPKENLRINSGSPDPIAKSLNYFIQHASVAHTKDLTPCLQSLASSQCGAEEDEFAPSSIDEIMSVSGLDPRDFPELCNYS